MTRSEARKLARSIEDAGVSVSIEDRGESYCVVVIPFLTIDLRIVQPIAVSGVVNDMKELLSLLED